MTSIPPVGGSSAKFAHLRKGMVIEMIINEQLNAVKVKADNELKLVESSEQLETLRVKFLGKKGELTAILSQMGKLSAEERPVIGQIANDIRVFIENEIKTKKEALLQSEMEKRLEEEKIDITLPGKSHPVGKKHP
jgi:phenylalanyl-tRNA synthetase alpha chain